ncbi:MAG TPA: hypothetical protein PKI71_11815, partial [Candidatus Rifleibacterium sp.]|nr:hypothetical protein [Candidatus Rifleibacterium sp.]
DSKNHKNADSSRNLAERTLNTCHLHSGSNARPVTAWCSTQILEEQTDQWSFMRWQLGLDDRPQAKSVQTERQS